MKIKNPLNFLSFIGTLFLLSCSPDGEGLYPSAGGAETVVKWERSWTDGLPERPFPNDTFINDGGFIEINLDGDRAAWGQALSQIRFFSPAAPIAIPFSGPLAAGFMAYSGVAADPILLVNANPKSKQFGRLVPYKVASNSTSSLLFLEPLQKLEARSAYAVLITRELADENGQAVGASLPWINDPSQNETLAPLFEHGLYKFTDVSFAWSFTVRDVAAELKDLRAGLYGEGTIKALENIQLARTVIDNYAISGWYGLLDSLEIISMLGDYYEEEILPLGRHLSYAPSVQLPYYVHIPSEKGPFPMALVLTDIAGDLSAAAQVATLAEEGIASVVISLPLAAPYEVNDLFTLRQEWWQAAYHVLQLVRTVSRWDCQRYLPYDANSDGRPDLAGDFDGDGRCELTWMKKVPIYADGRLSALAKIVAAVEPLVDHVDGPEVQSWPVILEQRNYKLNDSLLSRQILDDFDAVNF